ncbi:MAG TPA: hypothetical protein VGX78_10115 [Pirellulales bacterium]|nr:hypothetical protein [Pirellulales bacterium]
MPRNFSLMRRNRATFVLLVMLVVAQGCAPFVRRSRLDYRTM